MHGISSHPHFCQYEQLQYHQKSKAKMIAFRQSCSDVIKSVACMLNKEYEQQLAQDKEVLTSLFERVCLCAKQGLSFKGYTDDYTVMELDIKGNFMS